MVQKRNFNNFNKFFKEQKRHYKPNPLKLSNVKKIWILEVNTNDNDYNLTRFDDILSLADFVKNLSEVIGSSMTSFRVYEVGDVDNDLSRYLRHKFFNKKKLINQDLEENNYEKY